MHFGVAFVLHKFCKSLAHEMMTNPLPPWRCAMWILLTTFLTAFLCIVILYLNGKKQKQSKLDSCNQNVDAFKKAKKSLANSHKLQRLYTRLVYAYELGDAFKTERHRIMLAILDEIQDVRVTAAICASARSQSMKNLEEKNAKAGAKNR